jgi:hypothetical protein
MAKTNYSYAKRQQELKKQKKRQEKLQRKLDKKNKDVESIEGSEELNDNSENPEGDISENPIS